MRIEFTVPAVPVSQPRPRATVIAGRAHVYGASSDHAIHAFKATVRFAATEAYNGPPIEGPVRLSLLFVMPRKKSRIWKTKPMPREWYSGAKDRDNLQKGVMDAMNKLAWADDKQVVSGPCDVVMASGYEQPHTVIVIETMDGTEPPNPWQGSIQKGHNG